MPAPLWEPTAAQVARTRLHAFATFAREHAAYPGRIEPGRVDYDALYRWSVAHPERFWPAVWRFCDVTADARDDGSAWDEVLVGGDRMAPPHPMAGPRWFTGARLNFAENLLRFRDDRQAIVSRDERGRLRSLTYAQLAAEVARAQRALAAEGVGVGDRVAGFMPNVAETVVAMLATASLGAIWSSCSPDFGVPGVLDRFGQIEPTVLICADGYRYAGKSIDSLARVRQVAVEIESIRRVVVVPMLRDDPDLSALPIAITWGDWLDAAGDGPDAPAFVRLPFDHPLYIMYSSGTTGLPKCMVHGAGGTLLQHLKEHVLHTDLGRDDRIFYFTTCGWMMWNWLVSALATGATVVLYDGSALSPHTGALWDLADEEGVTVFGTSARYLALIEKEGLEPARTHNLHALRMILSTGSPLAPPGYDYVYEHVKRDLCLSSISGGTDIISCFALGNPAGPVWRGELQVRGLGMKVEVFGPDGTPVEGEPGELVCTAPFPSMPVRFWNDPDGALYRGAYFAWWPGVWRHGD
ncbi:MAG TPA: acetoacetate--CoA ligase, partial [Gemmatimonadaceae bacterium]|nr:acetoacetate--CoA ligase [Gemmatimonadaceae bacterium]